MDKWLDGIYLLGQYNYYQTGLWLLYHNNEAAILEMPPYGGYEKPPYKVCKEICKTYNLHIKYFFCSHAHMDHFHYKTYNEFREHFPSSKIYLHQKFQKRIPNAAKTIFFDKKIELNLGGEALFLIYAPKHSWTDTMVVFRGAAFTGDWELDTIRSVHDGKGHSVPKNIRLKSIEEMMMFEKNYNYKIHTIFSVHANDKRYDINFTELMLNTKIDRKLW